MAGVGMAGLVLPDAPRVIGLCGDAGAGKSTAAALLARVGYTRLRFADGLKSMVAALLAARGVGPDDVARMIEGDLKEVAADVLDGRTPRYIMQTLGTEWGRDCVGSDFWVRGAAAQARAVIAAGGRVVFEDVRFANEVAHLRGLDPGAVLWRVSGRGGTMGGGHVSERAIAGTRVDDDLHNDGELSDLAADIYARVLA